VAGWKRLLRRLLHPFRIGWFAVAALFMPALALVLAVFHAFAHMAWPVTPDTILIALPATLFATTLIVTNTGPLGEELGWRGYALPRLLERWNALASAIILGLVWTIWHVPAFFISGVMGQSLDGFGWWALDTLALSVVITWLFVRAGGNVLIAG